MSAIELGRTRAETAAISVNFIFDDLTNLQNMDSSFDLLVDYGTLDDLIKKDRKTITRGVFYTKRITVLFSCSLHSSGRSIGESSKSIRAWRWIRERP